MTNSQPYLISAGPRFRKFAAAPMALQAIVVNPAEQILLMYSPTRKQGWQVVSGALEAAETILDGTLREVREELGAGVWVRPLGVVHVETFHFDQAVRYMMSSYYLLAYEGGEIQPGDDMAGSEFRWWDLDEMAAEQPVFHDSTNLWVLRRAVQLFRIWHGEMEPRLQQPL